MQRVLVIKLVNPESVQNLLVLLPIQFITSFSLTVQPLFLNTQESFLAEFPLLWANWHWQTKCHFVRTAVHILLLVKDFYAVTRIVSCRLIISMVLRTYVRSFGSSKYTSNTCSISIASKLTKVLITWRLELFNRPWNALIWLILGVVAFF